MPFPAVLASGLAGYIVIGLASGAVQIVLKVLSALGFGYLTFTGIDYLTTQNQAQIFTLISQMPPLSQQLLGVLQIGTCVKILFSALVMRLTIFGLNEGVIKRMQVVS
ncbi:MAG: DUF2523 family protein [Polaromonas sp.]|nr:DUF2523 family protein [Polaromonas sp.]